MRIITNCVGLTALLPFHCHAEYVPVTDWCDAELSDLYDVIVYAWHEEDGAAVLKQVRRNNKLPIIVLCAHLSTDMLSVAEETKIISAGADYVLPMRTDYNTLYTRIRACRRRVQSCAENIVLYNGRLVINQESLEVWFGGVLVRMTRTHRMILCHLAQYTNHVRSREQIMQAVYGIEQKYPNDFRVVDAHIVKLRRMLARCDPELLSVLVTSRGLGYVLMSQVEPSKRVV